MCSARGVLGMRCARSARNVRAVAWHPLSDLHVGVLTSTSWALLNLAQSPSEPEMEVPRAAERAGNSSR